VLPEPSAPAPVSIEGLDSLTLANPPAVRRRRCCAGGCRCLSAGLGNTRLARRVRPTEPARRTRPRSARGVLGEGVRFKGFAPVHGGCLLRLQLLAGLYALTPLGNVISNTGSGAMRSCHRDPLWHEGSVRSSVDAMSDEGRVRAEVVESPLQLHCPRCGLAMSARSRWIAAKHCPRCVARAHKLVVLLTDSAEADRLIRGVAVDEAQRTRGTR
jgi:hypothetical protein